MPEVNWECHQRGRNENTLAGSRVTVDTREVASRVEGTAQRDLLYSGKDSRMPSRAFKAIFESAT